MGSAELLDVLVRGEDRVPRAVIDECARHGDAMLDRLEQFVADDEAWSEDIAPGTWWLRFHAAMILGLMPSAGAALLLVRLMKRVAVDEDENLEDWLALAWPKLFRNKPDVAQPGLRALAEDGTLDWYYRCAAADVLLDHAAAHSAQALQDEIDWAAGIAAAEREDWDLRVVVASTLLDYAPPRHRALVESLARRQRAPNIMFDINDVEQAFDAPGEARRQRERHDPWAFYSPVAIADRQRRWAEEAAESARGTRGNRGGEADSRPSGDEFGYDAGYAPEGAPRAGRNDPCPCGSGKKYKRCCLTTDEAVAPDDLAWRRVRSVLDEHRASVLHFIRRAYGDVAMDEAWHAFAGGDDSEFDVEGKEAVLFVPWYCHFWAPSADSDVADLSLHDVPPTAAYLQRTRRVEPLFRSYLESCLATPFSVFEIEEVQRGVGFKLRDLIAGAAHDVTERSGSEVMRRGDLVIGQLASAEGVTILEASHGFVIPPIYKIDVLRWRARAFPGGQPVTAAQLRARHSEVVALYWVLEGRIFDSSLPELRNTDGDEISLRRVVFDVPSAQEAFDALKHLASGERDADLLREAERDPGGTLTRVHFSWLGTSPSHVAGVDNILLGGISIRSGRLTVDVNSSEREERIRTIVIDALGNRARYRMTEIVSLEQELAERQARGDDAGAPRDDAAMAELAAMPEMKRAVDEMLAKHYESWVDERLPALDGRTPLEAAADADGREAVAALVTQIERDGERMHPPLNPAIVQRLRQRLGLQAP